MMYITKEKQPSYYIEEGEQCKHCNKELQRQGFFVSLWERKQFKETFIFCTNCIKEHKQYTLQGIPNREVTIGIVSTAIEVSQDWELYVPMPLDYTYGNSGISVYDINKMPPSQEQDKDMTRLAGRESFEGATIGHIDTAMLEQKDKSINDDDEALKLLHEIRDFSSKARIEEQDRGYIEYNPQESNATIEDDERRQDEEGNRK